MSYTLTETEKKILLKNARESITSALEGRKPTYPESTDNLKKAVGAFVTLRTKQGNLRGCIGTIVGRDPLDEGIRATARSSAFQDYRFRPLSAAEWPEIELEISVLTPMTKLASFEEIVTGTHGVYIRKGGSSAIFLPQVAEEQGWNRDELLTHLCAKAGIPGDAYKSPEAELFVFTALVFSEND